MILTAKDISRQLSERAEAFAQWIFPNGKRQSAEWCVGSIGGEPGESLKIHLLGDKAGVWADFAGDDKGDLLDLISAARGVNLAEAIKTAKDWLGISDPESVVPKKQYQRPIPKNVHKPKADSAVVTYLRDKRKLTDATIRMFKVSETNGGIDMAFPYISRSGELLNIKYIGIERDANGKKKISQEKGCAPSLFGWHTMADGAVREIVICEGEIDAMTWRQAGFPALSVPDGAGGNQWIDFEWENLQQFDTIWMAWDDDDAGKKAVPIVAQRLGLHRCLLVKIPGHKDANEALMAGADSEVFARAIASAKPLTPDKIKTPTDFTEKVIEKFYPKNGRPEGFFPGIFQMKYGARAGELTVWTGISGHGKSIFLSQIMLEAILAGERVAIGSFEMKGEQTLHRLVAQAEAPDVPLQDQIEPILRWMAGKLWIYDIVGNVAPKQVFSLMEYSHSRHGVTQFVIDSLMKCSVSSEDYDAQRVFLNDLSGFAKERNVHIHLVAHARKGRDESERPGKLDVKGSSDIINQSDNIMCVWRNKEKERKRATGDLNSNEDQFTPDAVVSCDKQRETGVEFAVNMNFFTHAFRFMRTGEESMQSFSITKRIQREARWASQFQ